VNGRALVQSLKNSELLRNTSILVSGTAIAQVIPVLLQPLLRRYYSPDTFGAYSVYLSIIGILSIIASLKYDLAIVLPRKDRDAANILMLSVIISFVFSVVLFFIILIWHQSILTFLNLPEKFTLFLFLAPAGIFFYSFYQTINNWLTRTKSFLPISVNKFVRRGVEGVSQIGLKNLTGYSGIVIGDILGHIANILSGLYQGNRRGLSLGLFSSVKIRYVAKKYSEFPRYNVIPSFMSACSFLLPAIFLNKFYSSDTAGYFDLSKLLLSIPLALISTSVSNVLLQSLSEKYRDNKSIRKDLLLMLGILSLIGAVEIVLIVFFGVEIFEFVFGVQWGFSGRISQILVWSYALNFIAASFSAVFISLNKIRLLSIWQIIYFAAILSLILFRNFSFMDFLKVYVSVEIFCYLSIIALMSVLVLKYERGLIRKNV
jgi:O-antigen/teichoic acid export membrane protein